MTVPAVRCAACGLDVTGPDVFNVREAQITWCQPFKRKIADNGATHTQGSHTDPQELHRTAVYMCPKCWGERIGPMKSRSLWPFLDFVNNKLRDLAAVWRRPPAHVKHDLFGEERRVTSG